MRRLSLSRAQRRRLSAALSLFVYVGAALLSLAHLAEASHARCPEHGEIVHVDEAALAPSLAEAPQSEDGLAPAPAPGDEHAHDHCVVCTTERAKALEDRHAPLEMRALAAAAAPRAPFVRIPVLAALYRVAPKTSPPAA